ncbi:MAG: ABC transporter substrate-binding protein [Euryarchaeota archaeon]|nr:ABC transporter substrate-binding protein [Euryarchaeota archaeon]
MNNKILTALLALTFMSAALAGCTSNDDTDDADDTTSDVVKIGFLNPATGPLAQDAAGFEYGALQAVIDLNAAQTTTVFEAVVADSGCDGTVGAAAAQSLVDANVVAVAGAACSGASMAANAVLSAAGIPMISYASTNPSLSDATAYPNFFRVVPSDAIQGPAAAAMMVDSGATNPAILHMTNDYGSGFADAIEAAWSGDVCAKIGYAETATSVASEVTQIADAGCDSIFMVSYVTDAAMILNEVASQNISAMLFSGDGPAGEGLLVELSDDTVASNLKVTAPRAGSSFGDFEARYDAANIPSIKQYVLTSYDAVSIIGKAYNTDSADMDASIRAVGTGYEGASGLHTFLASGDVGGAGYDICAYTATTSEDGAYACNAYWTVADGVTTPKTVIKLGFMNPLTGPLAQDAAGFQYGAQQAIVDLNAAYGAMGYEYQLVEVDSACDGTAAAAAAQTLVDSGVIAVGGAACSGATMAANAVLSAAGIPMISYASTNPSLSNATAYPDFFRIVPSDAIQGPAAAAMMEAMGATNPAIIHMTNDYGSGFADAIEDAWNGTLCQKIGYAETATSVASEITQIADAGCDSIFMVSYVTDAAMILNEVAAQGVTAMLFSGDGPAGEGLLTELSDDSVAHNLSVTTPRAGSSFGDFEARYDASNISSIKAYVLTSYDSIMMLGAAHQLDSSAMSTSIATTGTAYEGASGLHTFLANGDVGGAGYDICGYTATGAGDGTFTCTKYWTVAGGVQDNAA